MCRNLVNVVVQYLQLMAKYCIVNCAIQKLEVIENSTFNNTLTQLNIRRKQSKNKFDLQKTQQLLSNTKKSSFNKELCYPVLLANIPFK